MHAPQPPRLQGVRVHSITQNKVTPVLSLASIASSRKNQSFFTYQKGQENVNVKTTGLVHKQLNNPS